MRFLFILATAFFSSSASARPMPDLICREVRTVQVDPRTLATQKYDSSTLYRFKSGKLYLTPSDRTEYLYNEVVEEEPMRYRSGHKIIQFRGGDAEFRDAVFVHTFITEVRVSKALCERP